MIRKHAGFFSLLLAVVLVLASVLWSSKTEDERKAKLSEAIKASYGLANPGLQITDIDMIRDGSVYKAIFKMNGELFETYVDLDGRYIFPTRTDIGPAVELFQTQKSFFECLRNKNVVLFGESTTNVTIQQIRILDSSPYLGQIYFDCTGENLQTCIENNITTVPSWFIDNKIYEAVLPIQTIENLTGCVYS